MKKRKHVTEADLRSSIASLRQKVSEASTPGMGQKGPTLAAAQGQDPSNPLNRPTFNAAKDSQAANISSFGQAPKPAAPAPYNAAKDSQAANVAPAGQAPKPAAPAGPPLVNYEKDFPKATAIELQKKLNAAGEKLTVDGKMGPATRAAMARHPEITTQTDSEKAAVAGPTPIATPADAAAVAAPAAPAAPATPAAPAAPTGVQAQGDDEGNTTITRPDGSTMVVGPDGKPYIPGSNPNLPQNQDMRTLMQKVMPNFLGGKSAPVVPNASNTSPWTSASGAAPAAGQGPKPAPAAPTPAAGPTSTQVQTDDDGNHMITTPDGKTVVVGADGKPLPNGGKVASAAPDASPARPDYKSNPGVFYPTHPDADSTEKRTPAEIAASQDLSSANNAGNINAGLDPSDPRWKGPKPGAAPTATAGTPPPPGVWTESDELSRIVSLVHHR